MSSNPIVFRPRSARVPGDLQRILFGFDSISRVQWYNALKLSIDQQQIAANPGVAGLTGPLRTSVTPVTAHRWMQSGVDGNTCISVLADGVAARVTAFQPDVLFIMLSTNCVQFGVSDATCLANHTQIIQQAYAQNPGIQIAHLGAFMIGEMWPNGANSHDAALNAKDTLIQGVCTATGATYIPLRTAAFTYESLHNLPAPGLNSGPLTTPDVTFEHPNNDTGKPFFRDQVMPFCHVSAT
jgi:phage tail protein X